MKRQGRILIVDDEQPWRDQLIEALRGGDYYVDAASSLIDAVAFLKLRLYHVLLLDVRMNGSDLDNQEGIELLKELSRQGLSEAIKIIIITAYGTKEATRQAFKEFDVYDYIFKDSFNNKGFLEIIRQSFSTINLNLTILWEQRDGVRQALHRLEIYSKRVESDSALSERVNVELEDLLCRLFYRAREIVVRPLTPGHSGMSVLRVQPFYSEASGHEVVVKFGEAGGITAEYHNFKEYVQPYLGGGRSTTALDFRRTPYLGGIIYSLLGTIDDRLVDFGSFYGRMDEQQIKEALDRLFRDTCGAWYANRGSLKPLDLACEYQGLLQDPSSTLQQLIEEKNGNPPLRRSKGKHFLNPFDAVVDQPLIYSTYRCITHGDFNQHNLLVDSDKQVWMIDFQGTSHSHFLRDIAMFDSVVRFQLLQPKDATLKERQQMEEELCSIERFSQVKLLESRFPTTKPALAKAYAITVYLRTLASRLMYQNPNDDIGEYYVALLFHALRSLSFSSLASIQHRHALFSARLLADRLNLSPKKE